MSTIAIPPMPKLSEFLDKKDRVRQTAYRLALRAWKEVAHEAVEADKSNHFWKKK
jgi:hypothetical protein